MGPSLGDVVGLIPTRNSCLFVGADEADGIRIACELALQDDDDVPLFHHPLVRRDGEWSLLTLEEAHDAHKPWRALTRVEQSHAANDVQQLLQGIVGDDVFVASVGNRESPYSGLVELAQADVVAFNPAEQDGTIVEASWDAVVATVGDQVLPTEHYPMRWRVEGYPTPAQLSAMARR